MFCGNCGTEFREGLEVCANCGKPSKATVAHNTGVNKKKPSMLDFVAKHYRTLVEICLCTIAVGFPFVGAVLGGMIAEVTAGFGRSSDGLGIFLGLLGGVVVGFLLCVFGGGALATFLKMGKDIEELKEIAARNKE